MSDEFNFFSFLLERYAYEKNRLTGDVLKEWEERGITEEIYDNYEMYHQESLDNAFVDIDCLIKTGKHAW